MKVVLKVHAKLWVKINATTLKEKGHVIAENFTVRIIVFNSGRAGAHEHVIQNQVSTEGIN